MRYVDVQNARVVSALSSIASRLGDLSPAMRSIAATMEERVRRRFASETDPEGKRWTPHAPATLKSYPKQGNRRILDRYGDMLRSLNSRSDRASATIGFSAVTPSRNGQRTAYAIYHEFGTTKMPARKMLFSNPDKGEIAKPDEDAVLDILARYII